LKLKASPGVPMFIEKPIAMGLEGEIKNCFKVAKIINESKTIFTVGYVR
jgi:hypothetical protein